MLHSVFLLAAATVRSFSSAVVFEYGKILDSAELLFFSATDFIYAYGIGSIQLLVPEISVCGRVEVV